MSSYFMNNESNLIVNSRKCFLKVINNQRLK